MALESQSRAPRAFSVQLTAEPRAYSFDLASGSVDSFDPTSIPDVIAHRDRRNAALEKASQSSNPTVCERLLGLDFGLVVAVRRRVVGQFLDEARLSEELRESRQRLRENPGSRFDPELARVLFALACRDAVKKATGEYADALAQALSAKQGKRDRLHAVRRELSGECLWFANDLVCGGLCLQWVDKAWGSDWRERPVPVGPGLSVQEGLEATAPFREKFQETFFGAPEGQLARLFGGSRFENRTPHLALTFYKADERRNERPN